MAVLAVAPRREAAVLPAGVLPAAWAQLVPRSRAKATRGRRITNGLIALGRGGDRRLVPVQLELVGSYRDGSRIAFRVRPLRRTGHPVDRLATRTRAYDDVSILVDPSVTDAIKAVWNALYGWTWSKAFGIPPDPVTNPDAPAGSETFNGGSLGYYPGTADPVDGFTPKIGRAQRTILDSNWEASGYTVDGATGQSATVDRFTVYPFDPGRPGVGIGCCRFGTASGIQEVTNSSVYRASFVLDANGVEFGGLGLRGSQVTAGTVVNSLFSGVDMTGISFLGTADDRVSVRGSVFEDVKTSLDPSRGDVTDRAGGPFSIQNTDFTAVAFDNVELASGTIQSGTFQACSFQDVDFSGSAIAGGSDASPGGRFQPTFDGSIFEDVSFDGATLKDVSFAGVDFSAGKVSFEGATLTNVDFTGATGLQLIDWSTVTIEGNVYGLEEVGSLLDVRDHPEYLRTITFDGVVPEIDPQSGFDVEPATGYLIDPGTGVRLERDSVGALIPVDPETGEPLTDQYGDPLLWTPDRGVTTTDGQPVEIDYATGEVAGE
ncbi:MAG: pentapeptide repeat-containing protein [Thermoleophilia bacterium]